MPEATKEQIEEARNARLEQLKKKTKENGLPPSSSVAKLELSIEHIETTQEAQTQKLEHIETTQEAQTQKLDQILDMLSKLTGPPKTP